ncbi:hypothetical protein ANN_14212 [Periplaneta americana]|uniref:Uncharacterized protein n=1 Tax=Periplaneta americana TaxID=6978 RepID=A0ABQ8SWW5_PERAM|nr:hypothetical protein ANN_14212 [Periplaneta americana]
MEDIDLKLESGSSHGIATDRELLFRSLDDSMRHRIRAVIKADGWWTKRADQLSSSSLSIDLLPSGCQFSTEEKNSLRRRGSNPGPWFYVPSALTIELRRSLIPSNGSNSPFSSVFPLWPDSKLGIWNSQVSFLHVESNVTVAIEELILKLGDNADEMSPGSNTESYPAFAHIGLRENPGKNLNQVTFPDRESNPGHLVLRPEALTVTPQVMSDLQNCSSSERLPYHPFYLTHFFYQCSHRVLVTLGYINIHSRGGSPDFAPSDFHLFLHLKKFLCGQRFDGDDEVKTAVREWFASQTGEFYNEGIERLVPRLGKCLNNGGDYVEK